MTILDRPPLDWQRPAIPCRVKCQVLLNQLGRSKICGERLGNIENTHFDHRPPLESRKFDTAAWDTVPPANDPAHIEAITVKQHDVRTNGPGGAKRITTAGSDAHVRGKTRRLRDSQTGHADNMRAKAAGQPRAKSKIPSRGFPKGRKLSAEKSA